jgi:hypothetical protein
MCLYLDCIFVVYYAYGDIDRKYVASLVYQISGGNLTTHYFIQLSSKGASLSISGLFM